MMSRRGWVRRALPLILIGVAVLGAACGGDDTVDPGPAPPPPPPPPPPPANRVPVAGQAIPDRTVVEGQTVRIDLSASFSDPDGDTLTHVATTSNPAVATVGLSGTELSVTGGARGAAAVTVRVSDPGGLSATQSFAVEVVEPAPTTVTVTPDTATLTAVDQTTRLSADVRDQIGRPIADAAVVWSSGDTTVATVDTTGLVTAVANGRAAVTALSGEASDTASIAVSQTATTVEITPATRTLAAGDTVRLVATATDANGHVVEAAAFGWTSSDSAVTSVDSPGLVTGVAEGTATIRAAGRDAAAGVEGTAEITVLPPPPAPGTWRGLVVAPESRCSEYDVGHYRHPDSLEEVVVTALGDRLYEAYTGAYYDNVREVQVDHIVAKREAHDSGACAWSPSARRAFAHDVENRDAAEWLPDFNRCWYADAVVAVRLKYGLTVDEAERDTLEEVLSNCDSTELVFTSESWTIEEVALGDESGWHGGPADIPALLSGLSHDPTALRERP